MHIKAEEISKIIRDQIGSYAVDVDVAEVGTVISIGDGIARVHGIERTMAGEMIEFPHGVFGIALNLEEDSVGTVLLGEYRYIKEGDPVKRTGRIISVPRAVEDSAWDAERAEAADAGAGRGKRGIPASAATRLLPLRWRCPRSG